LILDQFSLKLSSVVD